MIKFSLTLASLVLAAGSVAAQAKVDADGNGLITVSEMEAALPSVTEETFVTVDTNGDGLIDRDELAAGRAEGMIPVRSAPAI